MTEHLRLLQNHQVPEIARRLGMTIEELKPHVDIIRNLDPKPGGRLNPSPSQYVTPDIFIVKVEDHYEVLMNDDGLPQLRINPIYKRLIDKGAGETNDETRAYVKDKFRSALWLLKSVDQRQKTIYKVARSIVAFQTEFLDHGIEHLKPLVLRDVANHRHARVDRQPRGNNNTFTRRGLSNEVLLPQRHQQLVRGERFVGHDQAAHQEDHRGGGRQAPAQ